MPLFTNIQSLPLLVAEGGGFDVFDPNGAGNFLWTLLIFALSFPLMWKMVFGPIVSALIERDAKASEAIHAAEAASEAAERSRAEVEVALGNANAEANFDHAFQVSDAVCDDSAGIQRTLWVIDFNGFGAKHICKRHISLGA